MKINVSKPAKPIPRKWHVAPNYCMCHPDRCACGDWAVYSPEGKQGISFSDKGDAQTYADRHNQ